MSLLDRVALVGVHGHGAVHLANIRRLQERGRCRLVAVADPVPPTSAATGPGVPAFPEPADLLAAVAVDVVVICTPIHTHADLAEAGMRAGADVLLEKPPVATMAEYRHLLRVCAETGRLCQVGFQGLGSAAVAALRSAVAAGALGEILSVVAEGAWVRPAGYFTRARWAGERMLDGRPVVDGVLTNPFAHAVAAALHVAGADQVRDVLDVEPDLFHANDIHSDDTSVVRIRTTHGAVTVAATLCAPVESEPTVTVRGSRVTAVLAYGQDTIDLRSVGGQAVPADLTGLAGRYERTDLLTNLIDHRADPFTPLLVDLPTTGAFTAVLDAVRRAPDPRAIAPDSVSWAAAGADRRAVVTDVRRWLRLATERDRTFTELGAPWTDRADLGRDQVLRLGGNEVGMLCTGLDVPAEHSPRPHLHPLRTPAGLVVTGAAPADHPWHLGVGIAVPDVSGDNLWGGPTFDRIDGYWWRADHGRIEIVETGRSTGAIDQRLRWVDRRGRIRLTEHRQLTWTALDPGTWRLDLATSLTSSEQDVTLGSPATNGRPGAGYGGLFWRLPAVDELSVRTAAGVGENAVHGTVTPWLTVTLRIAGRRATLLLVADPDADDPWFVRVAEYPAVGAAWAWERPVAVTPDRPLRRRYRLVIADGDRDPADLMAWPT